jgi:hypothetical protein
MQDPAIIWFYFITHMLVSIAFHSSICFGLDDHPIRLGVQPKFGGMSIALEVLLV